MTQAPPRATLRGRIATLAASCLLLAGGLALGGCYAYHEVHHRGHHARSHPGHGPWCAAEHGHGYHEGRHGKHRGYGGHHGYDD